MEIIIQPTQKEIGKMIRGIEMTGRESVLEKSTSEEVPSHSKKINVKIDHAKNIMKIEDYNRDHELGKYWKGTPKKVENHYTKEQIEEQSKHYTIFTLEVVEN